LIPLKVVIIFNDTDTYSNSKDHFCQLLNVNFFINNPTNTFPFMIYEKMSTSQ